MNYLFAAKGQLLICVQYTDSVAVQVHDYLYDRGWKMEPCEKVYYNGKMNWWGGKIQTYHFDANTIISI